MILYEDPKIAQYASRLKKVRLIRGLTQEQLANLADVNIKSIAAYEQNPEKLSNASVMTVQKLADSLSVDMEDIINFDTIRRRTPSNAWHSGSNYNWSNANKIS